MNKTNIENIDAIFDVMSKGEKDKFTEQIIQGTNKAIEEKYPHLGWINPKTGAQLTEAEYIDMINRSKLPSTAIHNQYHNKKETMKNKTIGRPPVSMQKVRLIDGVNDFVKENTKAIASVLLAVSMTATLMVPRLKVSTQINNMETGLSDNLTGRNYVQQQDGMFSRLKLNIEPSKFVDDLGLTSTSHMRLYILSTVIQPSDFTNILKELGYRSKEDYVTRLGYEHNEQLRAGEQYDIDYEQKLKDLVTELNKNPEKLNEYLNKYPELGFIYGDSYLVNNQIYTINEEKGRHH